MVCVHLKMAVGIVLAVLLYVISVVSSTHPKEQTVVGIIGQPVLLPCDRSTLATPNYPTKTRIYWQDLTPRVLHVFKDGNEEYVHQNLWYKNRTTINTDQLASGNLSLLLNPVNVRDNLLTCKVFLIINGVNSQECQITVNVAASYQKPTLNFTDMTLVCTTHGGFPEHQVTWRTHNRTLERHEAVTKTTQDPGTGTYNISSQVNVTEGQNITCSIYNPILNETQSNFIVIPASKEENHLLKWILAAVCPLVVLLTAVVLCVKYPNLRKSWRKMIHCCPEPEPENTAQEPEIAELNPQQ
ncbi:CD276 antigen isoform X1 [Oncorhynchus mykiss]|uniref:Ig-like domain-containing protein n=1 Tax=Oncorhynchus mykiss TaxID=8022 RepID=A0A8L0DKU4_ONCMY|nr:CD276 antigen isoform X1 [Oncorhynchus mykiss]